MFNYKVDNIDKRIEFIKDLIEVGGFDLAREMYRELQSRVVVLEAKLGDLEYRVRQQCRATEKIRKTLEENEFV